LQEPVLDAILNAGCVREKPAARQRRLSERASDPAAARGTHGGERTRTAGLVVANDALYQLSYTHSVVQVVRSAPTENA
jgi:hypothetical protein